jgi:hypothetical protein
MLFNTIKNPNDRLDMVGGPTPNMTILLCIYFPKTGLKPPTSVGKDIYSAPQVLQNTEPFDFSRRRFSH